MSAPTTVPIEKVRQLADSYYELMVLNDQKAGTMAQMIRGCIQALTQDTNEAARALERERRHLKGYKAIVRMHEPAKKVREDRERAFLYLQWLATQLENQSVRSSDGISTKE